ncbi:MAG TPA: acetyl-CoA carboxylase biotin carboxyl carrier protein [Gemmatimonadota bacterium]|nr:acetyl-CoA carboxylase biotin carboxyl carrier protein [Gemmatimonadota bacterium]
MNRDELRALIRLVEESEIDELEIRRWGRTVRIVKNSGHAGAMGQALPAVPGGGNASGVEAARSEAPAGNGKPAHQVASPMVGTFYRAPAPEAPPFVEIGDTVRPGQILCILEAMKLMNELESEVGGVVRKILVENGQPVEYGQVLFEIEAT